MNARRCQGCAAPLPESAPGETQRCRFCGLVHDAVVSADSRAQVHQIRIDGPAPARVARWGMAAVASILALTLVPLVGVWLIWSRTAAPVLSGAVASVKTAVVADVLTPATLKNVTRGYHPIDVAPPTGGYASLDAVAALPWALAIAQAWSDDVRLERIDLDRVRPDGTINVQDDAEASVRFRFVSPSRTEALRDQARMSASAEAGVGLWLSVKGGEPQVYLDVVSGRRARAETPPPHPSALTTSEIAAKATVRRLFSSAPFYNGYLIHLEREGWVWYFSTLATEAMPRVRARDGAVWPYK